MVSRHGTAPAAAIGNSLRSDVLPALAAGAFAVHILCALTWAHEAVAAPIGHPRFAELASFAEIPGWLERLSL